MARPVLTNSLCSVRQRHGGRDWGVVVAVEVGFSGRNPYSRSLVERIRMSKDTQWRRLLVWIGVVVVTALALGLPQTHFVPSRTLLASLSALAGGAGFAAAAYCLAMFFLERKLSTLFAAVAFSALGSSSVLQMIIDLREPHYAASGWVLSAAWVFASVLLLGSAYSDTKLSAANRLQTIRHLATAGAAVLAFPIVVLPYVIDRILPGSLSSPIFEAAARHSVDNAMGLASAVIMLAALRASHKRYISGGDGIAGLMCYFLATAAVGLLFSCFSADRFDRFSTIAMICVAAAWIALVVGNGIENAFAHKEAGERLEELETLHDVSWSLVGAGTVAELLDLFVSTLVSKLGARIAAVYLADEPHGLQLAAIRGSSDASVGKTYPLVSDKPFPGFHSGHTARAYASREVQIANDVFVDVEFVPWRVIAQDDGCAASIPLVDQDKCIGVLNVYFADTAELSGTRLRLLATIAAAGTSAVEFALSRQPVVEPRTEAEEVA